MHVVWTATRQAREVVDLHGGAVQLSYIFVRILSAPRIGRTKTKSRAQISERGFLANLN